MLIKHKLHHDNFIKPFAAKQLTNNWDTFVI